ncbi:MAG TPA: hypothetical protein VFB85_05035 [Vicinamibacterales bacterium]|jgi:hypothetical protein|nr:hypothetical protein [Vicinamibacterales bacterium]
MRKMILVLLVGVISRADAQDKRAQLDGVWILSGSPAIEMTLTPAGEAARARYDYLRDDPAMQCIPASFTRVMHTPSPPIEVRQHKSEVLINYEFMDIHRRVPIAPGTPLAKAPVSVPKHPHLGRSVARYDGDVLLIETIGQRAGILDTLGAPGLVQSDQMRTEERFIPDGDRMRVVVTHHDPVYYQKLVVTYPYQRLPGGEILPWDCTPEEANYKRFRERAKEK